MAEEMTAPLYFVQYIAIFVWLLEVYLTFSMVLLGVTIGLTIVNYLFRRSSLMKLREKALRKTCVQVVRTMSTLNQINLMHTQPEQKPLMNGNLSYTQVQPVGEMRGQLNIVELDSDMLVPGDLIILQEDMHVPCDCILVAGEAYVNEVTLTGESLPVPKFEVDCGPLYYEENQKSNVRSLLFEGTHIIKLRATNKRIAGQCLAVVQRTGFATFKGQIFRSLVFVRAPMALFQVTAGKFIFHLAFIGFIISMIILYQFLRVGIPGVLVAIKIADLIIFIAPPAIPIMTTFCLTMSLARLRVGGVFGINP